MFLAIIFVCFSAGECTFLASPVVKSPTLCIALLREQQLFLEANKDKLLGFTGACIELEENKGEI